MAGETMSLISTVTVGGTPAFITFSNIPQTFTDLMVLFSLRGSYPTTNGLAVTLTLNSTGSGSGRNLYGTGTGVGTSGFSTLYIAAITGSSNTANVFASGSLHLPNYTSSETKYISSDSVWESNSATAEQGIYALSTALLTGITSITLGEGSSGQGFAQYSSASLYGIVKGSGGATVS